MKIALELMNASESTSIPLQAEFLKWLSTTLQVLQTDNRFTEPSHNHSPEIKHHLFDDQTNVELSIRIVDKTESQQLNAQYRGKNKPTNILSFPCELEQSIEPRLLGDLVICAHIVNQEARQQGKPQGHHWAHMLIHGVLHLLGFDHIKDHDAHIMESLEVVVLKELGIANPYYLTEEGLKQL